MKLATFLTMMQTNEEPPVEKAAYVDVRTVKRSLISISNGARIEARGIFKRFGQRTVLSNVNLLVEPGELVAVIGTSGGGKTTLLRILGGITRADEGTLRITHQGEVEDQVKIRIMFQEDRLLRGLSRASPYTPRFLNAFSSADAVPSRARLRQCSHRGVKSRGQRVEGPRQCHASRAKS